MQFRKGNLDEDQWEEREAHGKNGTLRGRPRGIGRRGCRRVGAGAPLLLVPGGRRRSLSSPFVVVFFSVFAWINTMGTIPSAPHALHI